MNREIVNKTKYWCAKRLIAYGFPSPTMTKYRWNQEFCPNYPFLHWCLKGKRKKVRGDRRKGRVNVMGALRYSDKKRFVDFLNKSNSKNFYEVLKIFYQEIIPILKSNWRLSINVK